MFGAGTPHLECDMGMYQQSSWCRKNYVAVAEDWWIARANAAVSGAQPAGWRGMGEIERPSRRCQGGPAGGEARRGKRSTRYGRGCWSSIGARRGGDW